jgi:hypothetical protein
MPPQLFWYRNAYKATRQAIKEEGKNAFWQGMPLQFTEHGRTWTFGFWIIGKDQARLAEDIRQCHKAGFFTKKVSTALYLRKKPKEKGK